MKALHYSFLFGIWQSVLWVALAAEDGNIFNHTARAPGPFQIGEEALLTVSTDHEISEIQPMTIIKEKRVSHTYTVYHEGATYISLHFASLDIQGQCRLLLTDLVGKEAFALRGKGKSGLTSFWARFINGDTVVLSVTCAGDNGVGNFLIDKYAAGFRDVSSPRKEIDRPSLRGVELLPWEQRRDLTICGADDLRNSQCYRDSHATEYKMARSVAKIIINGRGTCTGWLIGNQNILVTNQHCIRNSEDALNSYAVFNLEVQNGGGDCSGSGKDSVPSDIQDVYEVDFLIEAIRLHDYTLVKLKDRPTAPLKRYGFLETEPRDPTIGEAIYIPQHPRGHDKAMAIMDSQYGQEQRCRTLQPVVSCYGASGYLDVRYTCDTEPGSSGSPVLSVETNKVIALHHCGEANLCSGNEGVPMTFLHNRFANNAEIGLDGSLPPTQPTEQCQASQYEMILELETDLFGYETTWELRDSSGGLIAEGGKDAYLRSNESYSLKYCLEAGTHTLTIDDSSDDGMCCQHNTGGFNVVFEGEVVGTGGDFGSTASVTFGSNSPSERPSAAPSKSAAPSNFQSNSLMPSNTPSSFPSTTPSFLPSKVPSALPSTAPSVGPSKLSSTFPSLHPSQSPSTDSSTLPSLKPSEGPSQLQSSEPTLSNGPSHEPSIMPSTMHPSQGPSTLPSLKPSQGPSQLQSFEPTLSNGPSHKPSIMPSTSPSIMPSNTPSVKASDKPSATPSLQPSIQPSVSPSSQPSQTPSIMPSATPSAKASDKPSTIPSFYPSKNPSSTPSSGPSDLPTSGPTPIPTSGPTSKPTPVTSSNPTSGPTPLPTAGPTTSGPTSDPTSGPTPIPTTLRPSSSPTERLVIGPPTNPPVFNFITPSNGVGFDGPREAPNAPQPPVIVESPNFFQPPS
ncbi:unnamed protein product [Cylindrotheca closterium]|uniref:Serine protease n=1 Tax=Cylindrotheca closterium TaxID=2856 RepID=A0AAD2G2F7_9STRA|nr:unnamed protein product [Cylindrotheca closterium]